MSDETFDFICTTCGFVSAAHPTAESRDEREQQHQSEHETGEPMPELADFRKD